MAKIPISSRGPALAEDEDLDDFYRPEIPATPRAASRAPRSSARASSRQDFADMPTRVRSDRSFSDDFDDGYIPEDEEDRVFLRSRRRVPVRKRGWLATRWGRIALALGVLAVVAVLVTIFLIVRNFFLEDPRFRIDTAASIQTIGNSELSRTQLLSIFGADVGHNIFTVPLAQRRAALQQLPWVQHATVMRLLPNQLRVSIVERVPVAFVRTGSTIQLVDTTGVLLTMPPAMLAARHYSFPVVIGINPTDAPETRAERIQLYQKFIGELSGISSQLSEVDVSGTEDVRAIMPSAGTDILVHFGAEDFAARYKTYQQHLAQWRQQYPHLSAIDLRYDHQTVLEMAHSSASASGATATTTADIAPTLAPAPPARRIAKPSAHKAAAKPALRPLQKPKLKATAAPTSTPPPSTPKPYIQPFDRPSKVRN